MLLFVGEIAADYQSPTNAQPKRRAKHRVGRDQCEIRNLCPTRLVFRYRKVQEKLFVWVCWLSFGLP